jgi:predicted RNA-binding protein with PUA-like domain
MKRAYWLMKSEPSVYPFSKLVSDGRTRWDGIRSYEARNNLRAMSVGDLCLFYHSNEGKEIVGVARVSREAYPDPTTEDDWSAVDIEPIVKLTAPVGLDAIRKGAKTKSMALVKKSRLSVTPVEEGEFEAVLAVSDTKLPRPKAPR